MSKKSSIFAVTSTLAITIALSGGFLLAQTSSQQMSEAEKKITFLQNQLSSSSETNVTYDSFEDLEKSVRLITDELRTTNEKVALLTGKMEGIPDFKFIDDEDDEKTDDAEDKPKEDKPTEDKPKEEPKPPSEPTKEEPNFVTNDRVNFRSGAGLDKNINRTLSVGEKLEWLDEEEVIKNGYTWFKVKDQNGKIGWVAKRYTKSE